MSISLAGPTAAVTTAALTSATYTFTAALANDNRSKAFIMSSFGGTQTGVQAHTVDAPKKFVVKNPSQFLQPSGYNVSSGRYGKVPKNSTRVVGTGSAKVSATQWETIPIALDIAVPAGSLSYDRANVEASVLMFIAALYDQKEEIIQALYDGQI